VCRKMEARYDVEQLGKGRKKMNIMATTTTLPLTAARGEPIGLFHSSGEDVPSAAESDPAAKNPVSLGRARCLGPSCESLNMEARQAHPCRSSLERGALYHGRRDSFRRSVALHSSHVRGHRRNSDRERPSSSRSRRPRHHWERCQGLWGTWRCARTTVSQPGTAGRDMPHASTVVVGIPRRSVFQIGRRVLADSELDDDSFP
jgi:hypothetical protein